MKTFLVMIRNLLAALLLICMAALNLMGQRPLPGHEGVYYEGSASGLTAFADTCEYVFEGEAVKRFRLQRGENTVYYSQVLIKRVFRGNLKPGTIEMRHFDMFNSSHGNHPHATNGVYFLSKRVLYESVFPDTSWEKFDNDFAGTDWMLCAYQKPAPPNPEVRLECGQRGSFRFKTREAFWNWFKQCQNVCWNEADSSEGLPYNPLPVPTINAPKQKVLTPEEKDAEKKAQQESFWKQFPEAKKRYDKELDEATRLRREDSILRINMPSRKQMDSLYWEKLRQARPYPSGSLQKTSTLFGQAFIQNIRLDKNSESGYWEYVFEIALRIDPSASGDQCYLDIFQTELSFNENVFGSNLRSNGLVSIERIGKTDPNSISGEDPFSLYFNDFASNTLRLLIVTPATGLEPGMRRPRLEYGINHSLFRLSIRLDTSYRYCDSIVNLGLSNPALWYALSAQNDTFYTDVSISPDIPITRKACRPVITSITPNIRSGKEEFLTIEGYNFCNMKELPNFELLNRDHPMGLSFKCADFGVDTVLAKDRIDFAYEESEEEGHQIWWRDSLIRMGFREFSYLDDSQAVQYRMAGSGLLKLWNAFGKEAVKHSAGEDSIYVPYSLLTHTFTNTPNKWAAAKNFIQLAGVNRVDGYDIYLDGDLAVNANAVAAIKMALKRWQCASGINWRIEGVANLDPEDDRCVIGKSSSIEALGDTRSNDERCIETDKISFRRSFDIQVNNTFAWNYDLTSEATYGDVDFYEMILHELGHAHNLGHVAHDTSLMFRTSNPNPATRYLKPDTNSREAAKFVADFSAANSPIACNPFSETGYARPHAKVIQTCDQSASMNVSSTARFTCGVTDTLQVIPNITGGIPPFWYIWRSKTGNQASLSSLNTRSPKILNYNNNSQLSFSYDLIVIDNSDPPNIDTVHIQKLLRPQDSTQYYTYDLWAQDDALDIGSEPNRESVNIWRSVDLWSRIQDSLPNAPRTHEMPILLQNNYLHVEVKNQGCAAYTAAEHGFVIKTYWTLASSQEDWPTDWFPGQLMYGINYGDTIGTLAIPDLAPGARFHGVMRYCPLSCQTPAAGPLPEEADNFLCYLARIVDPAQTNTGLNPGFTEVVPIKANVINFDQIITRNTGVIRRGPLPPLPKPLVFHVRNRENSPTQGTIRFRFDPTHSDYVQPLGQYGRLQIRFMPALDSAWRASGALGSGFTLSSDPDLPWIEVSDAGGAVFTGLPLQAGTIEPVMVRYVGQGLAAGQREARYVFVAEQFQTPLGLSDRGMHPEALTGGVSLEVHLTQDTSGGDKTTPTRAPLQQAATELFPPRPNPASGAVAFDYRLVHSEAHVSLDLIDLHGRVVAELWRGPATAGPHTLSWDSSQLPAGLYSVRLLAVVR